MGWLGPIKFVPDLMGDSPGAQPATTFGGGGTPNPGSSPATPRQGTFAAAFGETDFVDPTVGGPLVCNLPAIVPASKGSQVRLIVSTNPTVGTATPQNGTINPAAGNSIGGSTAGAG